MRLCKFASLVLSSLCFIVGGDAQSPVVKDNPVWTLEFIQVKPDKLGLTLGYLDDRWMRVREEAKRRGAVLNYHRIQQQLLVTPGSKSADPNSVVLLTEYKNFAAFSEREKLFASILREIGPSSTSGAIRPARQEEDLYETVETRVIVQQPAGLGAIR
jgi:hypothetical protein